MATRQYYFTRFDALGVGTQDDGTAWSGTDTENNIFSVDGVRWDQLIMGTVTAPIPLITTGGMDVKMDDANAEGAVYSPGGHTLSSPLKFIIGTSPAFFMRVKVTATDWSGAQFMCGFHGGAAGTMQAHQATFANYTDKATIGNYAGGALDVYTSTALNNAADVDTDTTINLTDADVAQFYVYVSAAGAVTYAMTIGGTAQTLTTVAFSFDSTDNVWPFIRVLTHTDTASLLEIQEVEIGLQ